MIVLRLWTTISPYLSEMYGNFRCRTCRNRSSHDILCLWPPAISTFSTYDHRCLFYDTSTYGRAWTSIVQLLRVPGGCLYCSCSGSTRWRLYFWWNLFIHRSLLIFFKFHIWRFIFTNIKWILISMRVYNFVICTFSWITIFFEAVPRRWKF